jgi:hypothetical protein
MLSRPAAIRPKARSISSCLATGSGRIRASARPWPCAAIPIDTKVNPKEEPKTEPTVYLTEDNRDVIAAYRREFPNHKVVILPPDDVA